MNVYKSVVTPFVNIESNWSNFIIITVVTIALSLILFLVLHILAGTISKKFLSFKNIGTFKKIVIYQLIGLIISSCFIPFIYFAATSFANSKVLEISSDEKTSIVLYMISMQVIIFMTTSIFLSFWLMIGITPSYVTANLLYLMQYKTLFAPSIIYMLLFFVIAFIFCCICNIFFKRNKKNSLFFVILPILGLVLFVIVRFIGELFVGSTKSDTIVLIVNILINWLLFLILITFGSITQKILDSTSKLQDSILYDNEIFVNNGYSKKAFENYIKTNNIKTGLFITFEFKSNSEIYTENRQISNILLHQFKDFLIKKYELKNKNKADKIFLFKTKWNEYGIFYEIDRNKLDLKLSCKNNYLEYRTENDCFKEIEKTYKKWFKTITYNDNNYEFKTLCFLSIYGVHTNQFDQLVHFNQNLKKNFIHNNYKNIVNVYNYLAENDESSRINFDLFKKQYRLDKAYLSLNEIKTKEVLSKRSQTFLIPSIIWIEQKIYNFEDIYKNINNQKDASIILRNIALRTLKLAKHVNESKNSTLNKANIIINYPIDEFGKKNFSLSKIVNKILALGIDKNRVIFNFNFLNFSLESFEIFLNNLKLLRKQGIFFSFAYLEQQFDSEKKYYQLISENFKTFYPDFIFVNKEDEESLIIKNKFKKSLIFEID